MATSCDAQWACTGLPIGPHGCCRPLLKCRFIRDVPRTSTARGTQCLAVSFWRDALVSVMHIWVVTSHSFSSQRSPLCQRLILASHNFSPPRFDMQLDAEPTRASRRRRLLVADEAEDTTPLVVPHGCELVADTFLVFQWQGCYCTLQSNITLYGWARRRSGAIEHALERYGWTLSPQLHRVSSKTVDESQWRWLHHIFVTVLRLFNAHETGDTLGRVRWLNIMECRLVFELLRRECFHHQRNMYPKATLLPAFLKRHGVEVESWPDWYSSTSSSAQQTAPLTPPPLLVPADEAEPERVGTPISNPTSSSGSPSAATALGDREWLSDVHIANLMFLLLHGQPRLGPHTGLALPLEMRDLFQCVYPMTDELFVQMLERSGADREGSLLMHAKTGGGITFACINPNNNHWRLVVLDGMLQQVVLFDPLGRALPPSVTDAINHSLGATFQTIDLRSCLQAEGWNCGVWAVFIASRYVRMVSAAMANERATQFQPRDDEDEYVVLDTHCSVQERQQNRRFAQHLRQQYASWLAEAEQSGRLLYAGEPDEDRESKEEEHGPHAPHVRAGMARSAARGRRFLHAPVSEQVWVDLTDDVGAVEVEREEEVEQSYEDLADNFIEFREDNAGSTDAASLRYSLPAQLQSDVLRQQIADFRAYRRQRFSLFRRGPLVEETTISGNIKSLLRFLGYVHYENAELFAHSEPDAEDDAPPSTGLDMTVFALPNINLLVLQYVEWLEQRRGKKRRAPDDNTFQPVSCATVSNYLNGLVSIVKFQLRHDFQLRDSLLDQLRNLRSQAESYAATQKRFEKVHPEWCSWQQLQLAREKCRESVDRVTEVTAASSRPQDNDAHLLLQLRELCLLCLFTICPPPRCSVIRLLEWDKTLVRSGSNHRWVVDLTDLSHAASRHKTHKRKGALQLPLPSMLDPYLTQLHDLSVDDGDEDTRPVFVSRGRSDDGPAFMPPTRFTTFVKTTFAKYTEDAKAPNPSLLRSIFTTWLYGLRYDTEDAFLAQIKASSAQWKAHSEQIAATVYNKQLVYQQREFAVLLKFCEVYSSRFAYDDKTQDADAEGASDDSKDDVSGGTRRRRLSRPVSNSLASAGKRRRVLSRKVVPADRDRMAVADDTEYEVEQLLDIRENSQGVKQVQVAWRGYRRRTWEPYESMQQQVPEMVAELTRPVSSSSHDAPSASRVDDDADHCRRFLQAYIDERGIDASYRWTPDRVMELELAAGLYEPCIKTTIAQLVKSAMAMVRR